MSTEDQTEPTQREAHAAEVRALMQRCRFGVLSTLSTRPAGFPYGSVVPISQAGDGAPLILVSALAQHTKNLLADPRVCLLVMEPGAEDPREEPRAAIAGRAVELDGEAAAFGEAAIEARHDDASFYLSLDFSVWRIDVEEVRYIGGFGQAGWVSGAEVLGA